MIYIKTVIVFCLRNIFLFNTLEPFSSAPSNQLKQNISFYISCMCILKHANLYLLEWDTWDCQYGERGETNNVMGMVARISTSKNCKLM